MVARTVLPTWFNHLEESLSYEEVKFKKFLPPVKASCPTAEKVNETPEKIDAKMW